MAEKARIVWPRLPRKLGHGQACQALPGHIFLVSLTKNQESLVGILTGLLMQRDHSLTFLCSCLALSFYLHSMWAIFVSYLTATRLPLNLRTVPPFCYCAYFLRILGYVGFSRNLPTNTTIFCTAYDFVEKADLSKGYQNPKRKLGVTVRFSEIIELKFGKKLPYILCILTLF